MPWLDTLIELFNAYHGWWVLLAIFIIAVALRVWYFQYHPEEVRQLYHRQKGWKKPKSRKRPPKRSKKRDMS